MRWFMDDSAVQMILGAADDARKSGQEMKMHTDGMHQGEYVGYSQHDGVWVFEYYVPFLQVEDSEDGVLRYGVMPDDSVECFDTYSSLDELVRLLKEFSEVAGSGGYDADEDDWSGHPILDSGYYGPYVCGDIKVYDGRLLDEEGDVFGPVSTFSVMSGGELQLLFQYGYMCGYEVDRVEQSDGALEIHLYADDYDYEPLRVSLTDFSIL